MRLPATSAIPISRRRLVLGAGVAAVLGLAGSRAAQPAAAATQPARTRLRLIGESGFAHRLQFQGTTVGGLSGIDYDATRDLYYLISDDGSDINPSRFYTARIALDMNSLGQPELLSVAPLRQADDGTYAATLRGIQVPDPEAIRWAPHQPDAAVDQRGAFPGGRGTRTAREPD